MGCAQGRENGLDLSFQRTSIGSSDIPLYDIDNIRLHSSLLDV